MSRMSDAINAMIQSAIASLKKLELSELTSFGRDKLTIRHASGGTLQFRNDGKVYYNGTEIGTGGSGGVTDHGALTGLTDDDHTQYLLVNGTRAMTGALDVGDFGIDNTGALTGTSSITSDAAMTITGTTNLTINGGTGEIDATSDLNMNTNSLYGVGGMSINGDLDMNTYDLIDVGHIWLTSNESTSYPYVTGSATDTTIGAPTSVQLVAGGTMLIEATTSGLHMNGNDIISAGNVDVDTLDVGSNMSLDEDVNGGNINGVHDIISYDNGSGDNSINIVADNAGNETIANFAMSQTSINSPLVITQSVDTTSLYPNGDIDVDGNDIISVGTIGATTGNITTVNATTVDSTTFSGSSVSANFDTGYVTGAMSFSGVTTHTNDITLGTNDILAVGNITSSAGTFTCNTVDASSGEIGALDITLGLDMNGYDIDKVDAIWSDNNKSLTIGRVIGGTPTNSINLDYTSGDIQMNHPVVLTSGNALYANDVINMYGDKLYLYNSGTDSTSVYVWADTANKKVIWHVPTGWTFDTTVG